MHVSLLPVAPFLLMIVFLVALQVAHCMVSVRSILGADKLFVSFGTPSILGWVCLG